MVVNLWLDGAIILSSNFGVSDRSFAVTSENLLALIILLCLILQLVRLRTIATKNLNFSWFTTLLFVLAL